MDVKVTALVFLAACSLCTGGVLPPGGRQVARFRRSAASPESDQPIVDSTQNAEGGEGKQQSKAGESQPGPPDLSSLVPGLVDNTLLNERGTMVIGGFSMMFMPMPNAGDMGNAFQNGWSMFSSLPGAPSLPSLPSGRR